jgi:spermidine synthase
VSTDRLPEPPDLRARRLALLVVAALLAAAGVAYELSLLLLGTVTVGATERANAVVLGAAMAGMGAGATFGGRLAGRAVRAFVGVEVGLAILGAAAAPALYWLWASLGTFWGPLLLVAFAIGACIGAEMPLLAALNDQLARQRAASVVAELTAADYLGAFIGAIAFAFAVRPVLGLVGATMAIAAVNLALAAAVPFVMGAPWRHGLAVVPGAVVLGAMFLIAPAVVDDGRQALYRDPVIAADDRGPSDIVITERSHRDGRRDTRLFLDGDLQLSSVDSYRYHEALVHPAIAAGPAGDLDVLVLGGGDCAAVTEALRHDQVRSVTLVELDPRVTEAVTSADGLEGLSAGCEDARTDVVTADAFEWVRRTDQDFDVIVADFPDPDTAALGRLYSVELFVAARSILAPDGAVTVQCGSPWFAPAAYWTCAATLDEAGWSSTPYLADVPSFGTWGFHLAVPHGPAPAVGATEPAGTRYWDAGVAAASMVLPPDLLVERDQEPSTVLDARIVEAHQQAWFDY